MMEVQSSLILLLQHPVVRESASILKISSVAAHTLLAL